MRKIFVIAPEDNSNFIKEFLSTKVGNSAFVILSPEDYEKQKEIKQEIKYNDINLLEKANFNAQLFQSANEDIPTRLLIPKKFNSFEIWNKEYTLLHELGHYFSMDKLLIAKYYSFLEEKKLNGQLYNIPLEIEAERYVFEKNKKLFKENANRTYLDYYKQFKKNIKIIKDDAVKKEENFEYVVEIRLFRYYAIINEILNKNTKTYKKHLNNIEEIKNILARKGNKLKTIVDNLDDFNQKINIFYLDEDFDSYIKFCKRNYEIFGINK